MNRQEVMQFKRRMKPVNPTWGIIGWLAIGLLYGAGFTFGLMVLWIKERGC